MSLRVLTAVCVGCGAILAARAAAGLKPDVLHSQDAVPAHVAGRFRDPVGFQLGALRPTGHEEDRDLHLALNAGVPLIDPRGGFYFVFQTGEPVFRKYDGEGRLVFERRMQGLEIDDIVATLPSVWPRRRTEDGEMPLVAPTIRTAAVDPDGNLWVSFVAPYTYVYDPEGDKIRTLQFRAAGLLAPDSLSFGPSGRLLVTPGLYEFDPREHR